jgi:hypothetical protein
MSLADDGNQKNSQQSKPGWQVKQLVQPSAVSSSGPLGAYHGQPILGQVAQGQGGASSQYIGRVVVELWDDGSQLDDAYKIIFSADATDGNPGKLLDRIAPALLKRAQKKPFG